MFNLYIEACPESPLGYNNLGTVQCDQGKSSIAIETLRAAIYRMPAQAMLWNSLATVLAEEGRAEESLVFYNEAIRLEPGFARPWHNLGFAYAHLGRLDDALAAYDHALSIAVDPVELIESTHSRAVCLIGMGRLEEGFRDYEIRNNPRFRAYVQTVTKSPVWQGETLTGKRVLAVAEQGLGDEFMFANILPDLARAVGDEGKLQIAVDPRLVALFARSFPKAEVGAYDDRRLIDKDGNRELRFVQWATKDAEPDAHIAMGSAIPHFRKTVADFPREAFLVPDAARVAQYRETIDALGRGPKIGICWRSMMVAAKRGKYYSALDMWGPILKVPGVTFVNVQYGEVDDELTAAMAKHGVTIHSLDGLDLKNDIDGARRFVRRPRPRDLRAHCCRRRCRQCRHRSLVPHRRPHLAPARHRRIPLVPRHSCFQPGEVRGLARADHTSGDGVGSVRAGG